MKTEKNYWVIPVSWTLTGHVKVMKKACSTIEDAIDQVDSPEQALPSVEDSCYLEGSFQVDDDENICMYNPEVEDINR